MKWHSPVKWLPRDLIMTQVYLSYPCGADVTPCSLRQLLKGLIRNATPVRAIASAKAYCIPVIYAWTTTGTSSAEKTSLICVAPVSIAFVVSIFGAFALMYRMIPLEKAACAAEILKALPSV
jgi:hypothetical protein